MHKAKILYLVNLPFVNTICSTYKLQEKNKGDTKMNVINIENITLSDAERQPCEIWTRVMGYHRPVSEFNRGKKSEYYSRKCFCEEKAVSHIIADETCACAAE